MAAAILLPTFPHADRLAVTYVGARCRDYTQAGCDWFPLVGNMSQKLEFFYSYNFLFIFLMATDADRSNSVADILRC